MRSRTAIIVRCSLFILFASERYEYQFRNSEAYQHNAQFGKKITHNILTMAGCFSLPAPAVYFSIRINSIPVIKSIKAVTSISA